MRSLKFRAWEKVEKKMLFDADPFALHVSGSNEPLLAKTHRNEDCIFEQYTGLKDKNGKEIYEGDILKDESNDTAVVIWREYQAEWGIKWMHMGIEDSLSHRMDWGHLNEVIGNINENQELLEQEDAKD